MSIRFKNGTRKYRVNGSVYIVSSVFKDNKDCKVTLNSCVKKYIENNPTQLYLVPKDDTISTENVCSAVRKEDTIAVDKNTP
ncbi:MAG: hypothetical protein IKE65_00315 [Clostridia bacterium]|nr:hypothetical protein [Clostridia bacterium]